MADPIDANLNLNQYIRDMTHGFPGFPVDPTSPFKWVKSAWDAAIPDIPEVGQAKRGSNNEILLYSGDKAGWQSPQFYLDKYGALPARMRGNLNPDVQRPIAESPKTPELPPSADKKPDSSTLPPGNNNPSLPGFDPAVQGKIGPFSTNPTTNIGKETANSNLDLLGLVKETYAQMAATKAADWDRMQIASQNAERSAMAKTEANSARQIELSNIDAWRAITQTKINANASIAAATAAAMTAAQRPDAGYMNAAAQLFQASAAPYARAYVHQT
jgi:hypothetical protein